MPGMQNMFNQQSYKTFTTEFVPSTAQPGRVGRTLLSAAFDLAFVAV
jgi:hypothetical protein